MNGVQIDNADVATDIPILIGTLKVICCCGEEFRLDLLPNLRILRIEDRKSVFSPQAGFDILHYRFINNF